MFSLLLAKLQNEICVFCVLGGLALDCAVGRSCSPPTVLIKKHDGKRLADDTALFSLVQTTVMLRSLLRCFIFYLNSCVYVFKLCMNIPKHYDTVLDKLYNNKYKLSSDELYLSHTQLYRV